jgi:hypothetical protein
MQLAATIASIPPPNIAEQIQQIATPFSIYPSAIKTPQMPREPISMSTTDGFSNVGFAGFNNSGGSRGGEFRRGRGRGGRSGGFVSSGYDNKGFYFFLIL